MKPVMISLAVLLLISACNKDAKENPADMAELKRSIENIDADNKYYEIDTVSKPVAGDKKQKQPVVTPDWDKKIVKNGWLNLEIKEYKSFYTAVREKVKSVGGYVAQEEQTQSDYKIENSLTIKVPVDQFDSAMLLLANNVEKINERKITSQDVSTEFIDTKSRVEAKKQVREKYTDLLKQAKNMEEILSVQHVINGVQEEIETATAHIQQLGHSSTFSTINLTYFEVLNSSVAGDAKPSLVTRLGNSFSVGWGWITDLVIGLVAIWPLFIAAFMLILIYKRIKPIKPVS